MSRDVTHPVTRMSHVTSRVTCGVTGGRLGVLHVMP
nr:MAG TPA: hypothetical protein [Caudoviricetes sp.]